MKIYTKTGDKGKTSLFGGDRVSKDTYRIEAYGSVDELNSHLGVVRALKPPAEVDRMLERIQYQLFVLGADLATPRTRKEGKVDRIQSRHIEYLEQSIDRLDSTLPPLSQFILPAGSLTAAELHVARTVCRRAERRVVQLAKKCDIGTTPVVYINRLSDFLFVAARSVNKTDGQEDVRWDSSRQD
jgi:cob(I)alamin adenosyltransferase